MAGHALYPCMILLLLLITSCYADPNIVSSPETVEVYSGETAVLRCQVQDLGRSTVSWSSVSQNFVIYEGKQLMTNDVIKYSLINVPEGSVFNLQILSVEKSDQGFYKCAIDGTNKEIITHLDVLDKPNFAVPQGPPLNFTECCIAESVSASCLPACYPDQVNLDSFDALTNCASEADLAGLSKCFTAGSNHDNCCLSAGVPSVCIYFCHNEIPNPLTIEHLTQCYTDNVINSIFGCFEMGFEHLPSEPTEVGGLAMHDGIRASILMKWSPPKKNPDKVIGYKIMYKSRTQQNYMSVLIHNPLTYQYRLTAEKDRIVANMDYFIYISALADHGISFGSVEVDVFVPDPSFQEKINGDINACCADRNVNDKCREMLCRSKTWAQFSTEDTLQCFSDLNSIFTCLVGERNHTNCCAAYDVTSDCLPLCSGDRPAFDSSLIGCVSQMNIIEGCIQEGYDAMPAPPSQLTLLEVQTTSAIFEFQPSPSQGLIRYVAEVGIGENRAPYRSLIIPATNTRSFSVVNLEPNTYYWVRVSSETTTAGSLPSETVAFLTYPDDYLEPTPPPVTNMPHNLTECCMNTGMPELCWQGCEYRPNITAYYKPMEVLQVCYAHIGSVLACAADGRDHTECCLGENMQPVCVDLCAHTKKGPLDPQYITCVTDTPKAVKCYMEGILDLPRHPDVYVANVSKNSITLQWEQPKTSGRIDLYIIEYNMQGMTNKTDATTDKNSYILQNLQPGKAYEITITSQNENGTSAPSPMIQVYTLADLTVILPSINTTDTTGRAYWQNITHCCENSVSQACQEQCLNKQQTVSSQSQECAEESHKMLACFADGQDHRLCCEQKNVPSICIPVCGGHALDMDIGLATCMSYAYRDAILSCFLENDGLIPGAPANFIVKTAAEGAVQMSWSNSYYCSADCSYTVSYWKEGQFTQSINVPNAISPSTLDNLETDQRYTFTVWAQNRYGNSPPAPWQTLFVTTYKRDVKVLLQHDEPLVDMSTTAILECETIGFDPDDPLQIVWYFNNNRKLPSRSKILRIDSVDPDKDEGFYTCTATDSKMSSSDTLFLPIRYAPKFDQLRDESAVPGMGNQMKLACWFWGFPDSSPEQWHKDGVLLRRNLTKYSMNIDQRYHTGITSYRIKIANVEESDYGLYSLSVSNKYGPSECHIKLDHPDDMTEVIAPVKPSNPLQCCRDNGVSELCQELCGFHVNISAIVSDLTYISCLFYFEDYIKCGADGRDHSKCCTEKGVLPYCIPFCSGNVPGNVLNDADEMLQCVSESPAIFDCAEKGATQLPFCPEDIILTFQNNGTIILVRWSKPYYSQDKIDHFTIYYNYTGQPSPTTVPVNAYHTEFKIQDVKPVTTYYVWMTSGNKFGNSQPSVIANITTPSFATITTPSPATDKPHSLKATPIENSAVVRLTWEMVNGDMYAGYKIYYKEVNDVRFQHIQVGRTRSYHFENLQAQTTYEAYVVAIHSTGTKETDPSNTVQFTTGVDDGSTARQKDSDDNSRKVAIGVGVTVAIIALIAIVFLVIFFVYRARVFKPRTNDSVAFENPGFGAPGQIKIHGVDDQYGYGRLEEDGAPRTNVYDNAAVGESSTDPAYENPMYSTTQPSDTTGAATLPVDTKS